MNKRNSAVYEGQVMHRRSRPRVHRLKYDVFYLLIDLDELEMLSGELRLFSRNRFNLFSFYERDHGDGTGSSLRNQVEDHLRASGIEPDGGAIRLLTMPRILGHAFNPLSLYFCHRSDGTLAAILYEVNNTFGQRHSYLLPVAESGATIRQKCAKRFYVSPFMEMAMNYTFRVRAPGARVGLSIMVGDAEGAMLSAVLSADRKDLCDAQLARAFALYPLLGLKVLAGIHWEALRLWLKGVRLRRRPPPPDHSVSVGSGAAAASKEPASHVYQ